MPATSIYALPYPASSDPADVPTDMQELCDRIELKFVPGTANGQIPVWDNSAKKWAALAREIAYAEITTSVTAPVGTPASAVLVVSAGAVSFDGSPIVVEFGCETLANGASANSAVAITLWDDTTQISEFAYVQAAGANTKVPCTVRRRLTPTAGSHTYLVKTHAATSTGLVVAGTGTGGANAPAYIRIERV